MSEDAYENVEISEFDAGPGEKKNNTTLWIILGIAAVVIICCICVVLIAGIVMAFVPWRYQHMFYNLTPLLNLV